MKYFTMLPQISYEFETGNYNLIDMFTRVGFNNNFFNNPELYYEEKRDNQISPEKTSFEKYQTFDYYWLLLLANKVYDVNSDWPTNQIQLSDLLDKYSRKKAYYIYQHAEIYPNDILYIDQSSYGVIESWNPFYRQIVIKEEYGFNLPTENLSTYSFQIRRLQTNGSYINVTNYCDPRTINFNFFGYKPYLNAPVQISSGTNQILNPFLQVDETQISTTGQLLVDGCDQTDQTSFQNSLIYKVVNNQTVSGIKVLTNNEKILSDYVEKTKINIISPTIASMYEDKAKQLMNDENATANTIVRIG